MFDTVSKLWAKQPERNAHQMTAEPRTADNGVVVQQPNSNQQMTTDQTELNMRGGGAAEVCCGCCAGLCAFECLEDCC